MTPVTGSESDLRALCRRAGLDVLAHGNLNESRTAADAWRPVIAGHAVPTVAIRHDRPDLVAELNRQWHRLAIERSVIGPDGEFLINIAGHGCRPVWCDHWTQVRLTGLWDLAGVLGPRPGEPEFVTISLDGDNVLGATTEEYDVWLIAVHR